MKGKKLVILISILAFLMVLIVLNSTLFTLQGVSINWMTTKYKLEQIQDEDIVDGLNLGESIFLLNKQKMAEKLEKENPYLRVVGIETKFPNKIVIHGAERETLYAVRIGANQYAVVDELGKVLDITTSMIFAGNALGAKPIEVVFPEGDLNSNHFVQGESIHDDNVKALLVILARTLREANYNPTASKGVFTAIGVDIKGPSYDITMATRNGMKIVLESAEQNTTDKFLLGLEEYNILHQDGVIQGTITVKYNTELKACRADYNPNKL